MKKYIFLFGFCFSIINLFAQSRSLGYNFRLNQLDFSRFPNADVFFTVTDRDGDPVDMTKVYSDNFRIKHNNYNVKVKEIASVTSLKEKGESELYIALIFDNSFSMSGRKELVENAAAQFIDSLKSGDYVTIVDFGMDRDTKKIPEYKDAIHAKPRIQQFSNSKVFLRKNIPYGEMTNNTYLYDALAMGMSSLNQADVLGKKAIIIFSDGMDIASKANPDLVQALSRDYDIPIYSIDLGNSENSAMKNLAKNSGGDYFFVKKPEDVANLYQSVLKLLKAQYRLTYDSPEQNIISQDIFNIELFVQGQMHQPVGKAFKTDAEKIGFINLSWFEKTGQESIPKYLEFLSAFPKTKKSDEVTLKIGKFWKSRGEYPKALAAFNIIARNPSSGSYSKALLEKASLFSTTSKYKEAQLVYNQMLKGSIGTQMKSETLSDLAKSYNSEGNVAMAINTYMSIVKDYEGSDAAAEALLQAGILNEKTGNHTAALDNFTKLLQDHGESKVTLYAKMELAQIRATDGNSTEAAKLYGDVINSNADIDMKNQASFKLSEIQQKLGNFAASNTVLNGLIDGNTSPIIVSNAKKQLMLNHFATGQSIEARQFFEAFSLSEQVELLNAYPTVPFQYEGKTSPALLNGLFTTATFDKNAPMPKLLARNDLKEKFSVIGDLYEIPEQINAQVFIPISQKTKVNSEASVYKYDKTVWVQFKSEYLKELNGFKFKPEGAGLYGVLNSAPKVVRLNNIYFDVAKSVIKEVSEANLYETIDDLKSRPDVLLEIAGHTDSTGTQETNIELSLARANAVKDFMIKNGVASERLMARGYGQSYPLVPNTSEENMAKNRRTEFLFMNSGYKTVNSKEKVVKYVVFLKNFAGLKEAIEEKKFYDQRGYSANILNDPSDWKGQFRLIIGIFTNKDAALKIIEQFKSEFKNLEPVILEM